MDKIFEDHNKKIDKEQAEYYSKAVKLMFKAIIKKVPREIMFEVLKEEKIIKRDWCKKGEKYKQYDNK